MKQFTTVLFLIIAGVMIYILLLDENPAKSTNSRATERNQNPTTAPPQNKPGSIQKQNNTDQSQTTRSTVDTEIKEKAYQAAQKAQCKVTHLGMKSGTILVTVEGPSQVNLMNFMDEAHLLGLRLNVEKAPPIQAYMKEGRRLMATTYEILY